jgi:hypothetical protein
MILPQDIIPEKSMFVMGSRILQILDKEPHNLIDPKIVYDKYISLHPEVKINYNYFLYALDWLYILNAIELTSNMRIKKCY